MISIEIIKQLRDETNISIMQCKKALEDADGKIEKARAILKTKGAEIASKKSNRTLKSGVIGSYIHSDNKIGVLVELLCETDFVARNSEFLELIQDIAMHIAAMNPESIAELYEQTFVKEPEINIRGVLERAIQKFGEKLEISRFIRYALLKE